MALAAVAAQNAVLSRALGVSRLLSLVDDTTDTFVFGIQLCLVLELSTVMNYLIGLFLGAYDWYEYAAVFGMVVCMSVAYLVVFTLSALLAPAKLVRKAAAELPLAAFNCLVLGTLLLSSQQRWSLLQRCGFAFGSALGYVLAVLLVTEGQRKLQNRNVPAAFRGLPATLLYLAALALAIYGITGYTL